MIAIDLPIWAARLRASRHARQWSRWELGKRLAEAADEAARDRLPAVGKPHPWRPRRPKP